MGMPFDTHCHCIRFARNLDHFCTFAGHYFAKGKVDSHESFDDDHYSYWHYNLAACLSYK
jgi:hypothetical protein